MINSDVSTVGSDQGQLVAADLWLKISLAAGGGQVPLSNLDVCLRLDLAMSSGSSRPLVENKSGCWVGLPWVDLDVLLSLDLPVEAVGAHVL